MHCDSAGPTGFHHRGRRPCIGSGNGPSTDLDPGAGAVTFSMAVPSGCGWLYINKKFSCSAAALALDAQVAVDFASWQQGGNGPPM